MINYIDSNTIDFIEYREMKKGIDLNLYLEMDTVYFLNIYERTAIELDKKFNELIDLDKKLTFLKRKGTLNKNETELYDKYVSLGQTYYERYSFLEDKITVLDKVINERGIILFDKKDLNYQTNSNTPIVEDELFLYLNQQNSNDDNKL